MTVAHATAASVAPGSTALVVFDHRAVEFLPPRQLAIQAVKLVDTFFCEGAVGWRHASRLPLGTRVRRESPAGPGGRALTTYTPYLLPERHGLARWTDKLNLRRMRRELRRLTRGLGRVGVVYDSVRQLPLVGTLGEAASAYYLYDDFGVDLTGREHGGLDRRLEHRMLAAVDVVFAVSQHLLGYARKHTDRVVYLPNGFNADLFQPRAGTAADGAPVIGSAGVISGRVDLVGLHQTALERPDWRFRLLGPVSETLEDELEATGRPRDTWRRLVSLPNVEHLPPRPLEGVPDVVAAFDVALVPYCLNRFTMASCPLKVYEYYAMGIPAVSTPIPEVLRFDPGIATVPEGQSYAAAIERTLAAATDPGCRQRLVEIARPHSTAALARTVIDHLLPGSARDAA